MKKLLTALIAVLLLSCQKEEVTIPINPEIEFRGGPSGWWDDHFTENDFRLTQIGKYPEVDTIVVDSHYYDRAHYFQVDVKEADLEYQYKDAAFCVLLVDGTQEMYFSDDIPYYFVPSGPQRVRKVWRISFRWKHSEIVSGNNKPDVFRSNLISIGKLNTPDLTED